MACTSMHVTSRPPGQHAASKSALEHTGGGPCDMSTKGIRRQMQGNRPSQDERPSTNNP
ncbi:hypothetical protein AXF42_Ash013957 [Apostasia shenzhenica]|uniref:Uncharacterized protein n=1 Tax=Apostasia shenzhenica TaxID=1088818 RepID=A0A2I0ASC4_9ASPA|nr:hypothetical protein AXF42_Ash013957 [Apostasia shenzhenica]